MKIGRALACGAAIFIFLSVFGIYQRPSKEYLFPASEDRKEDADIEMRAVWVSSAYCLDFPSKPDLSADEQKKEIDAIIDECERLNLNTVFFQAHPAADSLYKSDIFPVSAYLSASGNIDAFDPLEYIISRAHEKNIKLHAWVNPFRVSESAYAKLDDKYKKYCIEYDGKLCFDPGEPQIRQLIADGVSEIIEKYHPDGIHFDDYFYPYPVDGVQLNDSESYALYGGGKNITDFRRNNIDELIESVGLLCKKNNTVFGVSPFGVWANKDTKPNGSDTGNSLQSYTDIYADSLGWAQKGYVDYLCPQIYWSMAQNGVEFNKLCDWWKDALSETDAKLYIGIAAYKSVDEQYGWDKDEIKNQIEYLRSIGCGGFSLFRYGSVANTNAVW